MTADAPIRRVASPRDAASPSRTAPHVATMTVADSRSGATAGERRDAQREQDQQVGDQGQDAADRRPPVLLRPARDRGPRRRRTATQITSRTAPDTHRIAAYWNGVDEARPDPVERGVSGDHHAGRDGERDRRHPAAVRRPRRAAPATAAGAPGTRPAGTRRRPSRPDPSRSPRTTTPTATSSSGAVPRASG